MHYTIFYSTHFKNPLIATSGNISGMPLCITEEDAFCQLGAVADAFLVHNRRIMHRMDDSIVQIIDGRPMLIRRARGYIPYAIDIPEPLHSSQCSLGAGGHLKKQLCDCQGSAHLPEPVYGKSGFPGCPPIV